ncbi:octopamine receptor Oamb isoform X2 [Lutzomyia longipalpis]|uniref:octopamine receptor Oamb isoform X2 n=1 Tax=Lutzomyia longipalpis TaxID=7200 RepID=UPI002483F530|nr:octopamine receptor Oamb isoform X2 [Lutzomyia longipalpis]XP_055677216.1 octopamine receptor Oamb isoform X2 [Lutzomyia longipalpis]
MNQTECSKLIDDVQWTEPGNLVSLAVLAVINVLVIVGNCLVIAAVFCSHKLRSVTNFFIVSLAVADLLVGLAVLPFSATWEVFKVWIFGDLWCRIWLAVDVWMCTASILNLCAISLDRYVAVTRPVSYPSIMSTTKAKSLIAGIWVLSFVICFPPLVGWKDQKLPADLTYRVRNYTLYSMTPPPEPPPPCPWTCELTNDAGYVVYSALGSFYIPMLVMLFFYWRIYRAAVRTTRAINQGFKTTKGTKAGPMEDTPLTLRIHRGRATAQVPPASPHSLGSGHSLTTPTAPERFPMRPRRRAATSASERLAEKPRRAHAKVKISVSYPSVDNLAGSSEDNAFRFDEATPHRASARARTKYLDIPEEGSNHIQQPKNSKRTKAQVKRFRNETKAAKTLAIIVGGFIFCWLPFFTIYLTRAFCPDCIHPLLFSVMFWLGYCNSAINPVIYALFSKDFRFAFKRIIWKCLCGSDIALTRPSPILALLTQSQSLTMYTSTGITRQAAGLPTLTDERTR